MFDLDFSICDVKSSSWNILYVVVLSFGHLPKSYYSFTHAFYFHYVGTLMIWIINRQIQNCYLNSSCKCPRPKKNDLVLHVFLSSSFLINYIFHVVLRHMWLFTYCKLLMINNLKCVLNWQENMEVKVSFLN